MFWYLRTWHLSLIAWFSMSLRFHIWLIETMAIPDALQSIERHGVKYWTRRVSVWALKIALVNTSRKSFIVEEGFQEMYGSELKNIQKKHSHPPEKLPPPLISVANIRCNISWVDPWYSGPNVKYTIQDCDNLIAGWLYWQDEVYWEKHSVKVEVRKIELWYQDMTGKFF